MRNLNDVKVILLTPPLQCEFHYESRSQHTLCYVQLERPLSIALLRRLCHYLHYSDLDSRICLAHVDVCCCGCRYLLLCVVVVGVVVCCRLLLFLVIVLDLLTVVAVVVVGAVAFAVLVVAVGAVFVSRAAGS